ncbi:MAG: prolipoprotein diacylglyceryl transferase [Clostridia bacterium]|nr:prolipoprotein diacylglyceryl transferase [Clostridia bacterium]
MLFSAAGWYGFLIASGMAICVTLAYFMAKKRGYDPDTIFDVALICLPLAILGARTYYVLNDMAHNNAKWTIGEFFGFFNGEFVGFAGLAIYGGLLGGILGGIIVRLINKRKPIDKQITFVQLLDLAFCLVLFGQAVGRWGNFANGEAYGQLITDANWQWFPFAVFIEGGKMGTGWYNACFFYESAWNLIGFGLLIWLYMGRRKSFDGFYIASYCIWYGFIRFWVEGLRSDSMYFGAFKANQLISAAIFLVGVSVIVYHVIMARRAGKKVFIFVDESRLSLEYYGYEKTIGYIKTVYDKQRVAVDALVDNGAQSLSGEAEPSKDKSEEQGE